ncbi:MAG: M20 family metallopeptidase [Thermoanaerobaculia bacterium]
MFDRQQFLTDLATFVGFKTVVCQNPDEFRRANSWIRGFFDPAKTELVDFACHGLTSTLIRPRGSARPRILGDGHIEVVPGDDSLFQLREQNGILTGRGVADMKTQCLTMIYVLRRLIDEGDHNDFWLLFSEDEEVGSQYGVALVSEYLAEHDLLPRVVFAPDGGPDFAYVEKEKGIFTFEVTVGGRAAHASRPYLGRNAIARMMELNTALERAFPNPTDESDWWASLSMTSIDAGEASNKIPDRCRAGFDLRLTEKETVAGITARLEEICAGFDAELTVRQADPATYYPKEAPVARDYLEILRRVSGKEPLILHSAGASNGRIYVARDPRIHVLMSSPSMGSAHAVGECLDSSSLDAYYQLCYETARMSVGS